MRYKASLFFIFVLTFTLLLLAARTGKSETLRAPNPAPVLAKNNANTQAKAATEIVGAQATATVDSFPLTQSAALTRQNEDELAARTSDRPDATSGTQTADLKQTSTPTIGQMLKDHIVFYLIEPEKGRQDACGNIQLVPIISQRMRSDDKVHDVQVALQMLFSLKRKIYIQWYNALWGTDLKIDTYQYIPQKDYLTIYFGGYLPAGQLSNCDKHGIREQIWTTFFHYGIKEKTFLINNVFLIDQLSRKSK